MALELRQQLKLAQKLVMSPNSLLPTDALIKAFAARSARLLHSETIDELLKDARDPDEDDGKFHYRRSTDRGINTG